MANEQIYQQPLGGAIAEGAHFIVDNDLNLTRRQTPAQVRTMVLPADWVIIDANRGETFPTTLANDTTYVPVGTIFQSADVTWGSGSAIWSPNPLAGAVIYTGTGTLFTATDPGTGVFIQGVSILAVTPGGKCLSVVNTAGNEGTAVVSIQDGFMQSTGSLGSLTAVGTIAIRDMTLKGEMTIAAHGAAAITSLDMEKFAWLANDSATGTLLDIGSNAFSSIGLGSGIFDASDSGGSPQNAVTLFESVGNGNIDTTQDLATVDNVKFRGTTSKLAGGITTLRTGWIFSRSDDADVPNSNIVGYAKMETRTSTTIGDPNTPTAIAGTWADGGSERVTMTGQGIFTWDALQSRNVKISFRSSCDKTDPGGDVPFRFFVRHTPDGEAAVDYLVGSVTLDAGADAKSVSGFERLTLNTDDTVQLLVECVDDTDDIFNAVTRVEFSAPTV